jgi:hypothetical protein
LITELLALPTGAGVTAALATVARPKANAVPKKTVLIMRSSFMDRVGPYLIRRIFHPQIRAVENSNWGKIADVRSAAGEPPAANCGPGKVVWDV